ncbi:MAG: zinc-ribbon domain-containing protein [Desulfovermiculus sp.]
MQLKCEHCGRSFNLPEEKIPQAKRFRFTCPSCKEMNEVIIPEQDEGHPALGQDEGEALDVPPVRVPPGTSLALLFLSDEQVASGLRSYFGQRNWQIIEVQDPQKGRAYLQVNRVHWAVLEDSEPGREILGEINLLSGRERREINCVLIGDRTVSFDALTAFVLGVNSYVHPEDESSLETVLDRAHALFEDQRHMWLTAGKGHETGT